MFAQDQYGVEGGLTMMSAIVAAGVEEPTKARR